MAPDLRPPQHSAGQELRNESCAGRGRGRGAPAGGREWVTPPAAGRTPEAGLLLRGGALSPEAGSHHRIWERGRHTPAPETRSPGVGSLRAIRKPCSAFSPFATHAALLSRVQPRYSPKGANLSPWRQPRSKHRLFPRSLPGPLSSSARFFFFFSPTGATDASAVTSWQRAADRLGPRRARVPLVLEPAGTAELWP